MLRDIRKNILQMTQPEIMDNLKLGKLTVAVIGLGHVGLPLAASFAEAGARVIGADISLRVVKMVNRGKCPIISGPNLSGMIERNVKRGRLCAVNDVTATVKKSHAVLICVPTLLTGKRTPYLSAITLASQQVGRGIRNGSIVIVVSSLYPGATCEVVLPILEAESRLKAGLDFGVAYSPERIDPGNVIHRLDNTPRVVGGINDKSTNVAIGLFRTVIKAEIIKVTDIKTAEAVKIVENVYRDVNIAFVNELAILFEELGINANEVINAAATKWSFQPHRPGAGVGGMCIPLAPYFLMHKAKEAKCNFALMKTAREINESMPNHVVKLTKEAFMEAGKQISGSKIAVLGICYKGNVKDTKMTPAIPIINKLKETGAEVVIYDPLFSINDKVKFHAPLVDTLDEALNEADCMVIITDHDAFKEIKPHKAKKIMNTNPIIIDGRYVINPAEAYKAEFLYRGVGVKLSHYNKWCKK